jgi:homoserine O-acetyltransferase/O-succinyltransferase
MYKMTPTFERDIAIGELVLDCGVVLNDVVQRAACYGTPRPDHSNVVLVNHALTGSARVVDWWSGIVGSGKTLDTDTLAVICINNLGSCYGSTGPASLNAHGLPYGAAFPIVSVGDIVRAQAAALTQLGITRLPLVFGGSLGGMQALTWALRSPRAIDHAVVIGAYDHLAPMAIALNYLAREAIRSGATPEVGIELARKIGMLTYKSDELFTKRFGRNIDRNGGNPYENLDDRFDVEGYLDHQGRLFSARMDNDAYIRQTRAMDLFDVRDLPLPSPPPQLTFVGIRSDWLFCPQYIREAAERYAAEGADSVYIEMQSDHGHDAFLAEPEILATIVAPRLAPLYAALKQHPI